MSDSLKLFLESKDAHNDCVGKIGLVLDALISCRVFFYNDDNFEYGVKDKELFLKSVKDFSDALKEFHNASYKFRGVENPWSKPPQERSKQY
ncbi:hypothetical protein [Winogradskyella alexanderae]|uniref:Uncharacterized protein n=1 Tax=Winogradskyella alexanderae TaxID=2877123 RepID=A0ABS7XVY1_9FLAO|nr:hypothetical protein [Winogradskyella alexanderae]MCA0133920.1 hypothetical protein [Winogradskyella alexanderae]